MCTRARYSPRIPSVSSWAPEKIAQSWEAIGDRSAEIIPEGGMQQSAIEFEKAQRAGRD